MVKKLRARNRLTLPKAAVEALGAAEYVEVEVMDGQIILSPARFQRIDVVRAKMAQLGIRPSDVTDAVEWARGRERV